MPFNAKTKIAQIPASAVTTTIVINGTYTPNPVTTFTGSLQATNNGKGAQAATPKLANGNWTFTIVANALGTNQNYAVFTSVNGGAVNTVMIDGAVVETVGQTLTVSASP